LEIGTKTKNKTALNVGPVSPPPPPPQLLEYGTLVSISGP
jgi:hypothetical protein